MQWTRSRRWAVLAGAAVLVAGAVAVVQPSAQAATTIRVDSLTPYQMIEPGPITVSGHTTGSPAGETVRLLVNNDLKLTVPVVDGRFSGTFDTGPLRDGPYMIFADVADENGGQFSVPTLVYVDEDPGDIVVTSPAPGSTVTSFGDGLVIAGRVAHPDVVHRVTTIIGEQGPRGLSAAVAEDGTFEMAVAAPDVAQGPVRVAVRADDCFDWAACGALGVSAVTVNATPSARITAPTARQVFGPGTSLVSLGLQVTNPGPGDEVSAVIDGKLPVTMATPIRQSAAQSLYWTNVAVPYDVGEGRHTLHLTAKIRGVSVPVADVAFVVDFAPPTVPVVAAPATVLTSAAAVTWSATDEAGVASYDVRSRTTSAIQPTSGYAYPANLRATAATRSSMSMVAGKTFCFSARARDVAARTSGWSAERCTASPFDDRWLAGGKRVAWPGFYANTATTVAAKGSVSRTGVTATQAGIVARACPSCGSVVVTLAGVRLGTVSLKAPTSTRVVVWLPAGRRRTGTLTLTAPAGATLDGVFLRR